jgi:Zn-finger nucleic acid-binding protein
MKCPIDGTTLEKHAKGSVELEECPVCRGLWFERGELRKTKDEVEADLNWVDFDPWSETNEVKAEWSARTCPQCNEKMAILIYPETDVTIEYCQKGHGIWLDNGEFEAIIKSLETMLNQASLSDYISDSLGEAREIITGGEGFVSEWKDFMTVMKLLEYRFLADHPRLAKVLASLQTSLPY